LTPLKNVAREKENANMNMGGKKKATAKTTTIQITLNQTMVEKTQVSSHQRNRCGW